MKITKFMRFLLIAIAAVMVFSLCSCDWTLDLEDILADLPVPPSDYYPDGFGTFPMGTSPIEMGTNEIGPPEIDLFQTDSAEVVTTEALLTETTVEYESVESETKEDDLETKETELETKEEECPHDELMAVPSKEPTCTENGNEDYYVCVCGALLDTWENIIEAVPVVEALGHSAVGPFTYTPNPDGEMVAMLEGTCERCGELVTKPASFVYAIETVYGDVDGENVVVFQASSDIQPMIGNFIFTYVPGHPNYPENGYAPIRENFPLYGGVFGISGWIGYVGSEITDTAVFKVVDLEGNVLVDWNDMPEILGPNNEGGEDIDAFLATIYKDGTAKGIRFGHAIDVHDYMYILGGKTVQFIFAFNASAAGECASFIPYATLQVNVPECMHSEVGEVEAKAATCTETGRAACKYCYDCRKYILADGTLSDTAPVAEIDPNNHVGGIYVEQETHQSKCRSCGSEAAYSPNIQLGKDKPNLFLNAATLARVKTSYGLGEIELSSDGSYVTFHNDPEAMEGFFYALRNGDAIAPTGQYLMIKYRTTYDRFDIFVGANNGGDIITGNNYIGVAADNGGISADGEWHVIILDLAKILPDCVKPENGTEDTFIIEVFRLDVFNSKVEEDLTVDIAYIAFADSVEKLTDIDDVDQYTYYAAKKAIYDIRTDSGSAYFDALTIANKAGAKGSLLLDGTNNNMPYARLKADAGDGEKYMMLWSNTEYKISNGGRFVGILYRVNGRTDSDCFDFFINSTHTVAQANFCKSIDPVICDGTWRFGLADLSEIIELADTDAEIYYDPETGISSFRFDYSNKGGRGEDVYVDVAFISFFNSEEEATDYCRVYADRYLGVNNCTHDISESDKDYIANGNEGECTWFCSICGQYVIEEIRYISMVDIISDSEGNRENVAAHGSNVPSEIDMSKTALNVSNELILNGWCLTNSGFSAYNYRIVSVDGERVKEPTIEPMSVKIVNAEGALQEHGLLCGFTGDFTIGARYINGVLNFDPYRGKTIDVEIVATTTYGANVVIIRLNNIVVTEEQ